MKKMILRNIKKGFGKKTALSDINVLIEPGERFVIVGPTGSGKTTLLKIIAGLEKMTGGNLYIGDELSNHTHPSKRNISVSLQNSSLFPHLTVEQNIVFGLHVKGVSIFEQKERCGDLAKMFMLTDVLKRKPRDLTSEQRQCVSLARAFASEAAICLLDEPVAALERRMQEKVRFAIKQLQQRRGTTLVYATNDQTEAMTMGNRIMILKEGEVQQVGSPLDIYNKPANQFVATFSGSPPMNVTSAAYDSLNNAVMINGLKPLILENDQLISRSRKLLVGIRPEQIVPAEGTTQRWHHMVEIEQVEHLGNETIFSFFIGKSRWCAKWTGQRNIVSGQSLAVAIKPSQLTIFDGETGQLLSASRPQRVEVSL